MSARIPDVSVEVAELRERVRELERALADAVFDAAILAHSYEHDSDPPREVVRRSRERGKRALENRARAVEWTACWKCPDCGKGVAADEDGCCANCGADCEVVPK